MRIPLSVPNNKKTWKINLWVEEVYFIFLMSSRLVRWSGILFLAFFAVTVYTFRLWICSASLIDYHSSAGDESPGRKKSWANISFFYKTMKKCVCYKKCDSSKSRRRKRPSKPLSCRKRKYRDHSNNLRCALGKIQYVRCRPLTLYTRQDDRYKTWGYNGSFHKTLTHDEKTGQLLATEEYDKLCRGLYHQNSIKIGDVKLYPQSYLKLANPTASLATILEGAPMPPKVPRPTDVIFCGLGGGDGRSLRPGRGPRCTIHRLLYESPY
jgi:hypothetical protein